MSQTTESYGLYLEDSGETTFKEWREKMNGADESNMTIIDRTLFSKQDKLIGSSGEVVGFNKDGIPEAQSINELAEGLITVPSGGTITPPELPELAGGPWRFELTGEEEDVSQLKLSIDQILELRNVLSTFALRTQLSNQNLLINWYFPDPINQWGKTEYAGQNTYAIDRWYLRDVGGVKLTENGLLLSDSGICGIGQVIAPELSRQLVNKKLTLSLLTASGEFAAATCVVPPSGTFQAPAATTASGHCNAFVYRYEKNHGGNLQVLLYGNSEAVAAIKLELGTQQTLAHQDADGNWVLNDPPPDKALELAKCQRYQISGRLLAPLYAVHSSGSYYFMPLPTTLQKNPTIAGNLLCTDGNANEVDISGKTIVVNEGLSIPPRNGVYIKVAGCKATGGAIILPEDGLLDANL